MSLSDPSGAVPPAAAAAAGVLPDIAEAGIGPRELHVVLLVDCSGSMAGEKIASLNFAVRSALPALREAAEGNPETRVLVRALRISTDASWHVAEPVPAAGFEWADLLAGGETATGAALALLGQTLAREAGEGRRRLPPVVVLVSDGWPTDDFEAGLARLLDVPDGAKATRIAIAIGADADLDGLARFIGQPGQRPLVAHTAEMLARRIRWATTAPVREASRTPGEGREKGRALPEEGDDDLVW